MSSGSSGSSETVVASVVDVTQTIGDAETEDDFRGLDSFILLLLDIDVLETELVVMLMIQTTLDAHGQSNRNIRFSETNPNNSRAPQNSHRSDAI